MYRLKYTITIIGFISLISALMACRKEWLDAKPEKALVVPTTIKDFQALLDNTTLIFNSQAGGIGELSAGDFYLTNASYLSIFGSEERSAYIWAKTDAFYNGEPSAEWNNSYKRILNSNIILEGIEKVVPSQTDQSSWNNVKGSSLFYRAFDYYNLSQQFCKPYLKVSANTDLGLSLRTEPNVNQIIPRANLEDTYAQVISDINKSINLLPVEAAIKTRPSKHAAYALLARIFLSMEDYDKALSYADSALNLRNTLLNFNTLNASASYPIARFNSEVIYHSIFYWGSFNPSRLLIDPQLLSSYAQNDLRKTYIL